MGRAREGPRRIYTEDLETVIGEIWKRSEKPRGKFLKTTLPLRLKRHEKSITARRVNHGATTSPHRCHLSLTRSIPEFGWLFAEVQQEPGGVLIPGIGELLF
jgi:hypothetical protein